MTKEQPANDVHGNLLCPRDGTELSAIESDVSEFLELYCSRCDYAIWADEVDALSPWL